MFWLHQQEVRGSPCRAQPEGKVQGSQLGVRVYSRKKPKGKGHLKSESVQQHTCGVSAPPAGHTWRYTLSSPVACGVKGFSTCTGLISTSCSTLEDLCNP